MKLICKHCNKYYTCNIKEEDKRAKCLRRRKYLHEAKGYTMFTKYPYQPIEETIEEPYHIEEHKSKPIKKKNKFLMDKNNKSLIEYLEVVK